MTSQRDNNLYVNIRLYDCVENKEALKHILAVTNIIIKILLFLLTSLAPKSRLKCCYVLLWCKFSACWALRYIYKPVWMYVSEIKITEPKQRLGLSYHESANTTHLLNVWPMLVHRLRRWPNIGQTVGRRWANIGQTLSRCVVFAGESVWPLLTSPSLVKRMVTLSMSRPPQDTLLCRLPWWPLSTDCTLMSDMDCRDFSIAGRDCLTRHLAVPPPAAWSSSFSASGLVLLLSAVCWVWRGLLADIFFRRFRSPWMFTTVSSGMVEDLRLIRCTPWPSRRVTAVEGIRAITGMYRAEPRAVVPWSTTSRRMSQRCLVRSTPLPGGRVPVWLASLISSRGVSRPAARDDRRLQLVADVSRCCLTGSLSGPFMVSPAVTNKKHSIILGSIVVFNQKSRGV